MKTLVFLMGTFLSFSALSQAPAAVGFRRSCPRPPEPTAVRSMQELGPILQANNIEILNGNNVTPVNIERFLSNYNLMPENFRNELIRGGAKIRIMEGTGVGIDPSLTETITTEGTRQWVDVPGSGGFPTRNVPTRIAIDHLYDNHGSLNLVLHEHAHTLDSLYGEHSLSSSDTWKNLMDSSPRAEEFLNALCSARYCTPDKPIEAFAELFTYFHSCDASRSHMEEIVPEIAQFFSEFNSGQDMLAGRISVREPSALASKTSSEEECDTSPTADFSKTISDMTAVATQLKKTYPSPTLKSGSTSVSAAGMK